MIYPWGDNKRWNSYSSYFNRNFGQRIQKLTIDAGFSCPNRDGTVGTGGCAYCNNDAFNPSYCNPEKTISNQVEEGIEFHNKRYRKAFKYMAYFQAYSNTYAPLNVLRKIYEEALSFPSVVGLVIGTRPDCIDDEKLEYFAGLAKDYYVIIEYGVESCYDKTLLNINRGHNFNTALSAIKKTASMGINTGAHFIFGLPGETIQEMIAQVDIINEMPLNTVKFHQLQLVKGTRYVEEWKKNPSGFHFFEMDEYIEFFVDFLERLNPDFVLERFVNEVPPRYLVAPGLWSVRNSEIWGLLEKRLEQRNTWQGRLYI